LVREKKVSKKTTELPKGVQDGDMDSIQKLSNNRRETQIAVECWGWKKGIGKESQLPSRRTP